MTDHGRHQIPLDTIPSIVFMVFILVINGCVILLICCSSNMRSTSNIILSSLALSDFLVGFVGIPLLVACSSTYTTPICVSSNIFFTFISQSTVLHISVITCDRYFYITRPLRYRHIVQRRRVCAVLALTWLISLTSLVRLSWVLHVNIHTAKEDLARVQEHETTYFLFNFFVFFLSPLILMIIFDVQMLFLLRKHYQKIARENLPTEFMKREKKMQIRQRRAVLRCILLLLLYVMFWLPYFILELMLQNHSTIPEYVVVVIYYLRLCPPLFNPLVYALRKKDLKSKAKGIFCKVSNYEGKRGVLIKISTERSLISSSANV